MVFVDPVPDALNHKLSHHRAFRCRLVATARAVAVCSVSVLAVEVVGIGALEVAVVDVVGVVVHHVENHSDACFVQGLHHLFELVDAACWVVGVGRVASFRHVVVHGVIAPVVLVLVQLRLVYRAIVVRWQDVYGIDAQRFQVADGFRLGQCEKFSFMLQFRRFVDREVAVVHLVDDEVGGRLHDGASVLFPSFGVGVFHVDDSPSLSVHADSLGEDARSFSSSDVEGVESSHEVALNGCCPLFVGRAFHLYRLECLAALPFVIEAQGYALGTVGGEEAEGGLFRCVLHLVEGLCCCDHWQQKRNDCCKDHFFHHSVIVFLFGKVSVFSPNPDAQADVSVLLAGQTFACGFLFLVLLTRALAEFYRCGEHQVAGQTVVPRLGASLRIHLVLRVGQFVQEVEGLQFQR